MVWVQIRQGSNLTNDSLVDIVVGVIKDEVTESVKE